jgi:hypothetical protein
MSFVAPHHDHYIQFRKAPIRPTGRGGPETHEESAMPRDYEAIQETIRRAQVERSAHLAELISDAVVATWKGVNHAAEVLLSVARARNPKGLFTFDG